MASLHVRDLPDDVHRRLKAQAALSDRTLNEFVLDRLVEIADQPTVAELAARIEQRGLRDGPSSAALIRADRDR